MSTYALQLDDDELVRYRLMAARAREREADLWEQAGLVPGARVADVGCGPGAMLVTLAEVVGPRGHVVGIDADEKAVREAVAALARFGIEHGEARVGRADSTGLPEASFDTVVIRHVLAHNGSDEHRIVEHAGRLARPGGHVYLLDIDASESRFGVGGPDVDDLQARYVRWHQSRGNDLRVGSRLGDLGRAAGLEVAHSRDWTESITVPPGLRGPAWAARAALAADGLAAPADIARWDEAFTRMDALEERPQALAHVFATICRRPS